jgi:hypothetical protein
MRLPNRRMGRSARRHARDPLFPDRTMGSCAASGHGKPSGAKWGVWSFLEGEPGDPPCGCMRLYAVVLCLRGGEDRLDYLAVHVG